MSQSFSCEMCSKLTIVNSQKPYKRGATTKLCRDCKKYFIHYAQSIKFCDPNDHNKIVNGQLRPGDVIRFSMPGEYGVVFFDHTSEAFYYQLYWASKAIEGTRVYPIDDIIDSDTGYMRHPIVGNVYFEHRYVKGFNWKNSRLFNKPVC